MFNDLRFRLRALFRRNAVENELDDELQFHVEQQVEKHVRAGLTREEAMRQTRLQFGGVGRVKEECRESHGVTAIRTLAQDLRYGLRQLRKAPGFTATALLSLALGIGANAAIFTLLNAVLLESLPVTNPATLIRLGDGNDCCVGTGSKDSHSYFTTDQYQQFKQVPEFEELAAMQAGFAYQPVTVRREGTQIARSAVGEFVSGNYFRAFGLRPAMGRLLVDTDDTPGATPAAVISYQTWQQQFDADPSVVGSTVLVDTKPVRIVGVAPRRFYGDRLTSSPPDYYLPIESMPALANVSFVHDPDQNWLYLIGRVKPGTAIGPLQDKLNAILRHSYTARGKYTAQGDGAALAKMHVALTPGGAGIRSMQEGYGAQLQLLMSVAGLVLLIACANIANLLLVRGMARSAEMSLRTALGAARSRIVRQLLTESILLSALGGAAGLVVAYGGTRMLLNLAFPGAQSVPIRATPSLAVIGFALGLSLLTGVLFGIAPAWMASRSRPADALRGLSRSGPGATPLMQRLLVVLQIALSLVLLIDAGLFLQSLRRLESTDLKLNANNRYIVHINPQAAGLTQSQLETLYRTIEDRFHALPGVIKVGIASFTPMEDNNNGFGVQLQGRPEAIQMATILHVNADYFDSVGTHVLRGRGIDTHDSPRTPGVAVVNQTFVRKMFRPGEDPIGQHFGFPGPQNNSAWQIVGVVEDTVYQNVRMKNHLMFFVPTMQRPAGTKEPIERDGSLFAGAIVLATDRPVGGMEALAQKTLSEINPNLTVVKFQSFTEQIAERFSFERMISRLTMLFGALALLLATIGLYGVTAYSVARRMPEIGIRMALGAARSSVIAMVMRGALLQTSLGLAIGVIVSLLSLRFIRSQLYEIPQLDPGVLSAAILILACAASLAAIIPSRRAASISPVQALRME